MTTEEIKQEIEDFTRRLNTELITYLAFNSKRAALDAIESLTNLMAAISEDSIKAAVEIDTTEKIIKELEQLKDPTEDISDDDIKAHTSDPFGDEPILNVLESIKPDIDKSKLGYLQECSVKQYLAERTAYSFMSDLKKLFINSDDEITAAKIAKNLLKKPEVDSKRGIDRTDKLYTMKGYVINSDKDYIEYFLTDLINLYKMYPTKDLDMKQWIRSPKVINALAMIYMSYIGQNKELSKEEQKQEMLEVAKKIVLKLSLLLKD